jgi:outer membrane protein assembly factor BamA
MQLRLLSFALLLLCAIAGVGAQANDVEIVSEVRVHGNYATPDADVVRIAGITIGAPLQPGALNAIAKRLRDSGRFQQVEIRKRYRSLSDTQHVVLILLVQEHPAPEVPGVGAGADIAFLKPLRRLQAHMQFLPILNYSDGYGFTYGVRTSFANTLGKDSRVSVPLSLGANKRAAVEVDKAFAGSSAIGSVISRVSGGAAVNVRENPFFREDDGRRLIWARAERDLLPTLRLGGQVGLTHVNFEPYHDTFATYGADLTLDTRHDPIFPRNAILASVGWDALKSVNRYHTDVRGYIGVVGQSVLSLRARLDKAAEPVPPYEQMLLGGASSVRGFRTGAFIGDNRVLTSAELRIPFSSPLTIARTGVTAFVDSGAVYNDGQRLRDATFHKGVGGGIFLLAPFLQLNLDIAYGFGNRLRVHFTSGFQF